MKLIKFYLNGRHDTLPFDRQKRKHFTWGFDIQAGGKRYQERGYLTKAAAEEVVAKIKADAKNERHNIRRSEPVAVPFLFDFLQEFLNDMLPNEKDSEEVARRKKKERVRAKRVFSQFLKLVPQNIKVTDLHSSDFKAYVKARQSEGVSAATIRRELVPLSSALYSAKDSEYRSLSDYRPPDLNRPKVSKTRRSKVIRPNEFNVIMQHLCQPRQLGETAAFAEIRLMTADQLQFQLLTASRPGEVARLTRGDVDLFGNTVRIRHTKTDKAADTTSHLPITPTMAKILQRRFAKAEGDYLFTPHGQITPAMRRALKEACEANNIKYGRSDYDGVIFHTARHTATTDLVQGGVNLKTVGEYTGHTDEAMTMYYAHPDRSSLDKAGAILEEKRGGDFIENEGFFDAECEKVPSILN